MTQTVAPIRYKEQKAAFIKAAEGKDIFILCGEEWYKVAKSQFAIDTKYKWYEYTLMGGALYLHAVTDR